MTPRARKRRPKEKPRAARVADAILEELAAATEPLALADLPRARAIAADAREVYIVAERLRAAGALRRSGKGYQQGEAHRYELVRSSS